MPKTVINPLTGRQIKVGGSTYNNVFSKGRKSPKKKSPKRRSPSPLKGWHNLSPKKGTQRHTMLRKCGSKCFLDPKNEKFPVCSRGSCNVNCKGLLAAHTRARQYGYTGISNKAESLLKKHNC